MAIVIHEIWMDPDDDGRDLPGVCLAGPLGDGFRQLLGPKASLVHTFAASSHYEAMRIYNAYLGREPHRTDEARASELYPEAWARSQDDLLGRDRN